MKLTTLGVLVVIAAPIAAAFGALDLDDTQQRQPLPAPVYCVEHPYAAGVTVEPTAPSCPVLAPVTLAAPTDEVTP